MSKAIWTHCHICGRGIRESSPFTGTSFESSLIPDPSTNFYDNPVSGSYQLETRVDDSRSYFFLCLRCKKEFKERIGKAIRRFEKQFGVKRRFNPSTAKGVL